MPKYSQPVNLAYAIQHTDACCLTQVWPHEGERIMLGGMLVDYIGHLEHHLRQLPNYTHA